MGGELPFGRLDGILKRLDRAQQNLDFVRLHRSTVLLQFVDQQLGIKERQDG